MRQKRERVSEGVLVQPSTSNGGSTRGLVQSYTPGQDSRGPSGSRGCLV